VEDSRWERDGALAASGFGVAAHLPATSVLGARTRTVPSWIVGIGLSHVMWSDLRVDATAVA
jgi:hypothetical protein